MKCTGKSNSGGIDTGDALRPRGGQDSTIYLTAPFPPHLQILGAVPSHLKHLLWAVLPQPNPDHLTYPVMLASKDLATHYVKRVSKEITPKMQRYFPKCINTRPKMVSGGYPWEAWFPEAQVQNGVHFTLSVRPETVNCTMVLGNGCNKEWKSLSGALDSHSDANRFKKVLGKVYDQAPKGAMTHLYFMQRHFKLRTKGIIDAATELNVSLLLGKDGSKENQIWWDLLKDVAKTKSKYNYELHVGYELPYDEIPQLKTNDAAKLILRSFKNLKPVYELVTVY